MAQVEYSIEIPCSVHRVYKISQDYSIRYEWDPFPERIELLNGDENISVGTRVHVFAKSGLEMVVEFVQVLPPTVTAIKMVKGPIILQTFAGSWVFKAQENGHTRAIFKYTLKAKKWAIPLIMDKFLVWYFRAKVKARLDGLAKYCTRVSAEKYQ